ncbi:uncharacterized protein [Solanum lycopersicum]|uniref:uncharacterized protein n=1 Tax=Solanum lycopersicum TaxID=4081 RepID=UPI003747E21D
MPTRRANARNVNARNANVTPPIPNKKVSNADFRKAIKMLAMNVDNKNNRVQSYMNENGGSITDRVRNFFRIKPPKFLGSYTSEDLHNFLDKIKNIFELMQVYGNDRVELTSYQPKDVAHIWYTHLKENKVTDADRITWDCLSENFLDRFFPIDFREAKAHELMNLRRGNMTGQRGGNARDPSTTSASQVTHATQQGNSYGTGGGQCHNRLYAIKDRQDLEGSLDVGTSILRVFDLDVYALFDPRATVYFVTPYIEFQYSVSLETLSKPC